MTDQINIKSNLELQSLSQELQQKISRRVLSSVFAICLLSFGMHTAWSIQQSRLLQNRLLTGFANTIQSDVDQKDLISLRRTLKAFSITNPETSICLRLDSNLEVSDATCTSSFSEFRVPFSDKVYFVAVDVPSISSMSFTGIFFLIGTIALSLYILASLRHLSKRLIADLGMIQASSEFSPKADSIFGNSENEPARRFYFSELEKAHRKIREGVEAKINYQVSRSEAEVGRLALQVSHDIRSPLSALRMVLGTLNDIAEEKRLLLRNATQRINDIANQLLREGKARVSMPVLPDSGEQVMVVALLESILSEKRLQFREQVAISIEGDINEGYGLFANIDTTEFSRVMSNLLNNAVEAIPGAGRVVVSTKGTSENVIITVHDTGKGMPPDLLQTVGRRRVSLGKEGTSSGSGLGLHHAFQTIEEARGKIEIASRINIGTIITITLPRARQPKWFLTKVNMISNMTIVSTDDDQTIHQIWSGRLREPDLPFHKHVACSSLKEMRTWISANQNSSNDSTNRDSFAATLFFIDYEFLGQADNGLDLIESCGIARQAVLVTSRYDEPLIRSRCEKLGIKILPKSLAPFVPFEHFSTAPQTL